MKTGINNMLHLWITSSEMRPVYVPISDFSEQDLIICP